jgi:hypothetical protein
LHYSFNSVLSDEYKAACNKSIQTRSEYEAVVSQLSLAQEREQWKEIVQAVTQKFCKSQEEKVVKPNLTSSNKRKEIDLLGKCWSSLDSMFLESVFCPTLGVGS